MLIRVLDGAGVHVMLFRLLLCFSPPGYQRQQHGVSEAQILMCVCVSEIYFELSAFPDSRYLHVHAFTVYSQVHIHL